MKRLFKEIRYVYVCIQWVWAMTPRRVPWAK